MLGCIEADFCKSSLSFLFSPFFFLLSFSSLTSFEEEEEEEEAEEEPTTEPLRTAERRPTCRGRAEALR